VDAVKEQHCEKRLVLRHLRITQLVFEFPYVCPEPVWVKSSLLVHGMAQRRRFPHRLEQQSFELIHEECLREKKPALV
jgi:hypothetical protein